MKLLAKTLFVASLGLSINAGAANVNESDRVSVPISVDFKEPDASFTAYWQPATDLSAGSVNAGTELGQVRLSKSSTYAYKMDTNDNSAYPHFGRLIKEGDTNTYIPVNVYGGTSPNGIYPSTGGVPGWTIARDSTSFLRIQVRSSMAISAGTYLASLTVATASL